MIDKRVSGADAALEGLEDGMTVLFGGFGLSGIPENAIAAVRRRGTKNPAACGDMPAPRVMSWGNRIANAAGNLSAQ